MSWTGRSVWANDESAFVRVGPCVAAGGNAEVYAVEGRPRVLAKIIAADKRPEHLEAALTEFQKRLKGIPHLMPVGSQLQESPGDEAIGYLMPRIAGQTLDKVAKGFPTKTLRIQVATQLAGAFRELHARSAGMNDGHWENLIVSPDYKAVTLIDTDSCWLSKLRFNGSIQPWAAVFGKEGWYAPELRQNPVNSQAADCHALALLIHTLLIGCHPSSVVLPSGRTNNFELDAMAGQFGRFTPHLIHPHDKPEDGGIGFENLDPAIKVMFWNAFEHGPDRPSCRPTAEHWHRELSRWLAAERQVVVRRWAMAAAILGPVLFVRVFGQGPRGTAPPAPPPLTVQAQPPAKVQELTPPRIQIDRPRGRVIGSIFDPRTP